MFVQIRRNGAVQRRANKYQWGENFPSQEEVECSCLVELAAGQYIDVVAGRNPSGSTGVVATAQTTFMEIDILRDLS
jgi:hypothetical protein